MNNSPLVKFIVWAVVIGMVLSLAAAVVVGFA